MKSNKCFGIDDISHAIWDQNDDKAKSVILGYNTPDASRHTAPSKAAGSKPSFKSSFNLQDNLHDISAYDFFLVNMHDLIPSDDNPDEEPIDVEQPCPYENPLGTILINATKSRSSVIRYLGHTKAS
jgi:hypothetical protein